MNNFKTLPESNLIVEALDNIAQYNIEEIIRYGEFDPSDKVLDMVIAEIARVEPLCEIVNEAFNNDELIAKCIVDMHIVDEDIELDVLHKFKRRSKQLLREYAELYLQGIEDRLWSFWSNRAVPLDSDI